MAKAAGIIAKYFAKSLDIEKVVNAPRVINNCLPISTISISLVGSESKSTILPASFAACVPEFIATATSDCASAGASLVPSPTIATNSPPSCILRIYFSLVSGVASAMKSSTPASDAIAAAVKGLSPVIITLLIPILRKSARRALISGLTISLRCTTPKIASSSATHNGVPPWRAISSIFFVIASGTLPPFVVTTFAIASPAPFMM